MAMGMLAGRYAAADHPPVDSRATLRGGIYAERVTPRGVEVGLQFAALARAAGHDPAQLAYLWVKDQPGVTAPIIGPRTLEQWQDYVGAVDYKWTAEDEALIDRHVAPGHPSTPGYFPFPSTQQKASTG